MLIGYQGGPVDICAQQYAEAVSQYLQATKRTTIEEIHFVDLNDDTVKSMKQVFHDYFEVKKVANFDSRYLVDQTVPTKMTSCSKTFHGTLHLNEVSKSQRQHGKTQYSVTESNGRDKVDIAERVVVVFDRPVVCQSLSKSTEIRFTTYQTLQLYTANILEIKSVDVIVVCEDRSGKSRGAIVQQLRNIGGPKYISEKEKAFKYQLNFDEVIVTSGGDSQFKFVFHAILRDRQLFPQNMSKWYDAFQKILCLIFNKADRSKCSSIVMPVLGTGN